MCSLPVKQNRLKNRFNFCFSNGEFLEVIDFIGAPEGIRTPDPQIRSLNSSVLRFARALIWPQPLPYILLTLLSLFAFQRKGA